MRADPTQELLISSHFTQTANPFFPNSPNLFPKMNMSSSSRPQSKPLDLDLTILSAKHLHNCNWRQGDLKPYLSFWIEPTRRFTTKTDDYGSTNPVWNERFTIPINSSIPDSMLFLEVSHSGGDPSLPPPVVGSVQFQLKELVNSDESKPIRTLYLLRPSGRPQGKLRVRVSVKERERPAPVVPEYHIPPPPQNYYYSTAPPPPPREYSAAQPPRDYSTPPPPPPRDYSTAPPLPPRDYRGYSTSSFIPAPATQTPSPYQYPNYSDPYSGYYPGYYAQLPPPPRPYFDQGGLSYGGRSSPSAPVDYSSYDQRNNKVSKMGVGTGLAVGAVAGALGGLALEEGLKHEEEKIAERVEKEMEGRENYGGDYRSNY